MTKNTNNTNIEYIQMIINKYFEFREHLSGSTPTLVNVLLRKSFDSPYLSSPVMVGLDITDKCNLNCVFCYKKAFRIPYKVKPLSLEEWFNVLDVLDDMKVLDLYITGGEPFTEEYLLNLIKYAKNKNSFLRLGLLTNGTLVTESIAKKLSKLLDEDDYVQISLISLNPRICRALGSFYLVTDLINKIKILKEYRVRIKINTTIMKYNIHEMKDIYMLAHKLKVDEISFMPLFPVRNARHLVIEDYLLLLKNFVEVYELSKRYEIPIIVEDPIPTFPLAIKVIEKYAYPEIASKIYYYCPAGRTAIEIDCYGNVYPCPFLHYPNFIAGNIRKEDLRSIWKKGRGWYELRYGRRLENTKCVKCKYFNQCKGACPAGAYVFYGSINMPDGRCELYEHSHK